MLDTVRRWPGKQIEVVSSFLHQYLWKYRGGIQHLCNRVAGHIPVKQNGVRDWQQPGFYRGLL